VGAGKNLRKALMLSRRFPDNSFKNISIIKAESGTKLASEIRSYQVLSSIFKDLEIILLSKA
jgi:hypothetical protein